MLFRKESFLLLLGQWALSAGNLIFALGTVYIFGSATFGIISFYMLIGLMLLNVATAFFIEPGVSISVRISGLERPSYFVALGISYAFTAGLLLIPSFYLISYVDKHAITQSNANIILITVYIWLFVTAGILRAFLQAFVRPELLLKADIARSVLVVGALCTAIFLSSSSRTQSSVNLIVFLQVLALVCYLTCILIYAGLRRAFVRPLFSQVKGHLGKGIISGSIAIMRFSQVNTPLFISQLLLGEGAFGVIRFCQTIANIATFPLNAHRIRIMSNGAKTYVDGGSSLLKSFIFSEVLKILLMTGILSALLLTVLLATPTGLIPVSGGIMLVIWFLVVNAVISANAVFTSYFFSKGNFAIILYRSLVLLIVSIIFSQFLISAFGKYGAPISMFLVAVISFVWTFFLIKKDSKI